MLVSALMPTRNRRALLPLALACFTAQEWPERELVVLDDGDDSVEDLFTGVPNVVYMRHRGDRLPIGTKRNLLCETARGEVVIHWDDDDWSAPGRITDQVTRLLAEPKAQMSGYHSLIFWAMGTRRAYRYVYDAPPYSCGTAMCYRRTWWQGHRFGDVAYAEDNAAVYEARNAGVLVSADGSQMLVARSHEHSTSSPTRLGQNSWPEVPRSALPPGFLAAL